MAGASPLLGDTLSERERLEAKAYGALAASVGGGVRAVRGGLCVHAPAPASILNRVVAVTGELDLDAVGSVYAFPHLVTVGPGAGAIERTLTEHGYVRDDPWAMLARAADPAPPVRSGLRVEPTDDDALLAATLAEAFGAPPGLEAAFRVLAREGFAGYLAWDGDEPAGAALVYVEGALAWFGAAGTRPAHRGRGAQQALIAARIEHARAAGAQTLYVETAPEGPSNRNVRAAGFVHEYERANWRSPS